MGEACGVGCCAEERGNGVRFVGALICWGWALGSDGRLFVLGPSRFFCVRVCGFVVIIMRWNWDWDWYLYWVAGVEMEMECADNY